MAPYEQPYRNRTEGLAGLAARLQPNLAFIAIILAALIAFEMFNFSTTEHALNDLLGDLTFVGLPWATILALAFCGIDFAGIARLFTPEQGGDEPKEVWYLFGAWMLAAMMNATLTWWGVSLAVANHTAQSSSVISAETVANIVPVFVAVMVWVIRILIIGSLSLAMDRALHPGVEQHIPLQTAISASTAAAHQRAYTQPQPQPRAQQAPLTQPMNAMPAAQAHSYRPSAARAAAASSQRSQPAPAAEAEPTRSNSYPEPTYHSLASLNARPANNRPSANPSNGSTQAAPNNRYRRS